jgi:hypothetical protein
MAITPQQPHPSWYRQFWYADRSPLNTLVDRLLIFAMVALLLLAGTTRLARHVGEPQAAPRAIATETAR